SASSAHPAGMHRERAKWRPGRVLRSLSFLHSKMPWPSTPGCERVRRRFHTMANGVEQNRSGAEIDSVESVRVFPSNRGWHVKVVNRKESIFRRKGVGCTVRQTDCGEHRKEWPSGFLQL